MEIPRDLSILGFDDRDTRNYVYPRMTAICQDARQLGYEAFSELAEGIAESKGIELTKTIPNETRYMVWGLSVFVYIGSLLVLWIFAIRPIYRRIRNGKK